MDQAREMVYIKFKRMWITYPKNIDTVVMELQLHVWVK